MPKGKKKFLRWRAIMHAIESLEFIPELRKSAAEVGEPDTEPTDQLTISAGVSPKYNSFFVSGVSPIISNITQWTGLQSFKARIEKETQYNLGVDA